MITKTFYTLLLVTCVYSKEGYLPKSTEIINGKKYDIYQSYEQNYVDNSFRINYIFWFKKSGGFLNSWNKYAETSITVTEGQTVDNGLPTNIYSSLKLYKNSLFNLNNNYEMKFISSGFINKTILNLTSTNYYYTDGIPIDSYNFSLTNDNLSSDHPIVISNIDGNTKILFEMYDSESYQTIYTVTFLIDIKGYKLYSPGFRMIFYNSSDEIRNWYIRL